MGNEGIALLVLVILLINGFVWYLIIRRIRNQKDELQKQLIASGANIIIGPETGTYRGSTKRFGNVKSLGTIALTGSILIFRKPFGSDIQIPVEEIAEITKNVFFLHSYHSGREHLILKLKDGTIAGFIVKDINRWMIELEALISI